MQYVFEISTTHGTITNTVDTTYNFEDAPFLVKGFRTASSSTCDPTTLDKFWEIVESILKNNNISIENFIEVVRAYRNQELLGECDNYQLIEESNV